MNKILELREKRAKAWDAAKAFLDTKRGGDGLLSAEDTATYLQAHLQEKVSISDLAHSSGYSKSYFIVLFKQIFGTSPAKYQQMLRIEKSKQLLSFSALAISSIAEMCGYDSVFAFSNVFKKIVGMSPTQY